jgi:TRAP-type C4-dicarboxylate transport system permease small subunit
MSQITHSTLTSPLQWLNLSLHYLLLSISFLSLPLALLLFAQWPLRELIQAWSRQANDMAQIVFAIYVAVAVTAASRSQSHLACRPQTSTLDSSATRWRSWALLACTAPWALFMLWASWPLLMNSVAGLEHFAETNTPGYFLVKLALPVLLLLVLLQALLEVATSHKPKQSDKS